VTVKLDEGKSLLVDGTLVAQGTSGNVITFTSSVASPFPGDPDNTETGYWGYIEFRNGSPGTIVDGSGNYVSGQILEHCYIEHAGLTGNATIDKPPFVNNCTFANNMWGGWHISAGTDSIIKNSTILGAIHPYDNGVHKYGISGMDNALITSNLLSSVGIEATDGSTVSNNTLIGPKGLGIRLNSIDDDPLTVSGNTIMDKPGIGLSIQGSGNVTISNNIIIRNGKGISVGGTGNVTISNNTIADSVNGTGISVTGTSGVQIDINGNRIHRNSESSTIGTCTSSGTCTGSALHITGGLGASSTIQYNSITGSTGTTLVYLSGTAMGNDDQNFTNNNMVIGSEDYLVYTLTSYGSDDSINLQSNWWGTTDTTNLDALIYDWNDNATRQQVNYTPLLTAPNTTTPPSPPTNVAVQTGPTTIALTWDANPESDITGYKVHYDTDAAGYPYATSTDVGNVTSYNLTSLTTATTYYTAVSAYDSDGNESWVSTDVAVTTGATDPVITPADDASASEGDSLSLQLASFSDIDLADTHTASIEWGDGTSSVGIVSESSGSGTVSGSHTYADSGIFTVTVTVEDSGGGASSDTLTITVSNIAPTVYAGSDSVVGGTAHYTLSPATFTDPGSADTHTATVDWGDGAITVAFVNEESRTVSSSHRYQDKGTFTVTVTVTDDDGASGSDSSQITVTSVPVTVAIPSVTGWGMLLLGSILTILIMFRLRKSGRPQTRH
jgi:parallel beta-helix repeat protein